MPDPIPSGNPLDEPKRKSGFDPQEYEAEKAQTSESELPLHMRMYKAVADIVEERTLELPEEQSRGIIASLKNGILFFSRESDDNPLRGSVLNEKIKPFEQSALYLRAVMLPVDDGRGFYGYKSVSLGHIAGREIVDKDFIAVSLYFDITAIELDASGNETYSSASMDDNDTNNNLFTILIGPELPPTMIQERHWDRENVTWQQKLSAVDDEGNPIYPRHELTDEECSKILIALKDCPLF